MPRTPLLVAFAFLTVPLAAQEIPLSQHAIVSQRIGLTTVTVDYNRPVARGRKLFGDLVPWRRRWHPGANQATTITFSKDVLIEGQPLPAGSYTLWTIPDTASWVIIFNKGLHGWHTDYPGEDKDALRVTVTPEQGDHMETLAYYFPVVGPDSAIMRLHWGTVIVPIRIHTR
ncbi:MAG TPA: DUF2911 domain-containing protein [Gemmatimonadales bacterium]|nr:DUF2911 domain-containing protein [Gemmatimonadales bacterium]